MHPLTTAIALSLAICNAVAAADPQPLRSWRSSDGLTWMATDSPIIALAAEHPALLALTKPTPSRNGPDAGTILLYTRRGPDWTCARSIDAGHSWVTPPERVVLNGLPKHLAGTSLSSLSAVQLDDGRIRIYFDTAKASSIPSFRPREPGKLPPSPPSFPPIPSPPPTEPREPERFPRPDPSPPTHPKSGVTTAQPIEPTPPLPAIHSAISNDGLTFAVEDGVRFTLADSAEPEVIRLSDPRADDPDTRRIGPWLMFLTRSESVLLATSKDGLTWTRDETFVWTGAKSAAALTLAADGPDQRKLRLFAHAESGAIISAVYDPATGSIAPESGSRIPGTGGSAAVCTAGNGSSLLMRPQAAADKPLTPGWPVR